MKKKVFKYAMVSVLFLLTILGIKSVSAEVYEGQAIWPSEFIPNIYIRKTRNDGYIKYQQAQFIRRSEDNKFLYCLQPYVDIDNNLPYYNVARSDYETVLNMSKEQWNRISLLAYYGYTYDANGYDHSEHKWYAITQVMIWRTTNPDSKIVFTDTLNGNTIESKFANEIAEIENLVANHYKTPNFNVDNITIPLGQSVTLTDVNGVLGNYKINGTKNVSATINGNTITITATNVGDASIDLIKKTTVYETNPIVYFSNHSQNVMRVGNYDPVLSSTNAKIIGGRVTTEKVDSLTELTTPRGDGQLVGSIFGVYTDDDKRVGQVTIGENSVGTSDYLPSLGKFYLKEEIAGTGYTVSDEKIYFEITEDNLNPKVTVKEQIIEKDVELFKMFADGTTTILTGEPNITFEFYLKSSMELYASATTNEKGRLLVRLPYGRYVVKQVNTTPNYEKVDDFEIVIDDSKEEIITKIITNAEITAKLKLVKVDSITNKIIKRNGIKFKIKNLDTNEYVCQTISYPSQQKVCEFKTVDGVFITPYVLSSGNYQIEEIEDQIIPGYIWNRNPLKFSIGESSTFIQDEDNGLLLEVFFENTEVRGAFELTKLGEKLVLENDSYRYDEIKLDGVLFDLYADEDIYSADGTLVYKKNDIVESFKTVDGYYKNDKLHLGSYCVKEKESVLDNMVIDTPYCFTLSYKDQYTEVISTSFTVKNELEKGTLVFSKTDLGGKPIPNTWIEIYSDKDDESTLIYSGYTDEEGKIVLEKLFVGKGHIIEKEAADGFQITDEIVYFEIKENGEIVKANMTNEQIVEVPNTYKNDSKVIPIISITLMVAGLGAVIYASKKKENKVVDKRSRLFNIVGSLLFLFGAFLYGSKLYYDRYLLNKDNKKIEEFFEVQKEEPINKINVDNNDTTEQKEEVKDVVYNYIGVLEIPKINVKRGFLNINDKNNKVDKNIEVIKESDMPDVVNGNLIIAGHSGNSRVGYFTNLYKLKKDDEIYVYYNSTKYIYKIVNKYEIEKSGKATIHRNKDASVLTLITCVSNTNKQLVVISELDREEKI